MRPYEVMIIFDPTLEDDALRAELDRSSELIRSRGGAPGRVERWGKRRLSYEIRRQREGNYVVLQAEAEPSTMADLDRSLTLTDGVLRHKVVHLPEKAIGKPARPLGSVGADNGSPESSGPKSSGPDNVGSPRGASSGEPASPTPAPAPIAAETATETGSQTASP